MSGRLSVFVSVSVCAVVLRQEARSCSTSRTRGRINSSTTEAAAAVTSATGKAEERERDWC